MEGDIKNKINANFKILPKATKDAFLFLSEQKWIGENGWYLAGGTALALQSGNRVSVDLDFFTTQKDFDNNDILSNFLENKDWSAYINKKNTVYGTLYGAKMSFIAYPFFIPKTKFIDYGFIKILDQKDIAIMKIIAISQRGAKRDFFDLYWCVKNIDSLENFVRKLKTQYPFIAHDYHHIIAALHYFGDAEQDNDPKIYFKASWKEVKEFFKKESLVLMDKIMDIK